MDSKTDQKFMDMIMEKICEKYFYSKNKSDIIYGFDIDDFVKDISHPTDPDDGGVDIKGWGPEYIKENLLPALQREGRIEILSERQVQITQKGKDFCNQIGI
ncbi:MAG: hypothetical protein ACTHJ7_11245 [Candidatus Nitrosocosmicus sp.]